MFEVSEEAMEKIKQFLAETGSASGDQSLDGRRRMERP